MAARTRRRPRTVRALAAATGTVAVVALVGACGADASGDADPEHRTFTLPGRTLTVDSEDSALELVPGDSGGKEVKVTRWFDGRTVLGSTPEVSWKMSGDRITFRTKCSGVISDCSVKHRVEVPRGVAVTVENEDGRVTASGFGDALKVRSQHGAVTVEKSGGPLDVRSDDGSVEARGITSKRVAVASKDGAVRLALAAAPDRVDARSEDGALTVTLPRTEKGAALSYDVKAEAHDGSVDVSVPRDGASPHRVSALSDDGKVTVRSAN